MVGFDHPDFPLNLSMNGEIHDLNDAALVVPIDIARSIRAFASFKRNEVLV